MLHCQSQCLNDLFLLTILRCLIYILTTTFTFLLFLPADRELNDVILNFAAGLKAHGLQQGDKVRAFTRRSPVVVYMLCSSNSHE